VNENGKVKWKSIDSEYSKGGVTKEQTIKLGVARYDIWIL
jgi:hypothetical protein